MKDCQLVNRYIWSILLKRIFMFKCNLSMLRLTTLLTLLALPMALTRLICVYKRERHREGILTPIPEALVLSAFPIAWFFGFLYYTEVPSLVSVVLTVVAASEGKHTLAALVPYSCHLALSIDTQRSILVWSCELHFQADQHRLGSLCVCCQSAYVPTIQTVASKRGAPGEAA